ncbi:MAG: hypothetical protein J5959_04960 [Butyrivibrio sp.]|nr:hypothetical protein [Butyrivibrio sp.]
MSSWDHGGRFCNCLFADGLPCDQE